MLLSHALFSIAELAPQLHSTSPSSITSTQLLSSYHHGALDHANNFTHASHVNQQHNCGRNQQSTSAAGMFQCPFCFKNYSTWNSLKKHKSVYHREQFWDAREYQRIMGGNKERRSVD